MGRYEHFTRAFGYYAGAGHASRERGEQEKVVTVLRQLNEARKNYDPGNMDELLAPAYIEISPLGEVDPRAKVLSFYTP